MPLPSLTINGFDLESYGLRLETITGPWDLPDTTDPTIVVPGLVGVVDTGAPQTVAPRTISLAGLILKPTAPRTNADLLQRIDTLKALFAMGILEVTIANQPTRVFATRCPMFKPVPIGAALVAVAADLTATLICKDPIAYDLLPVGYGFLGARVPCEIGTAPSKGMMVRITGPATNPNIIVRNYGGDEVHRIGLTRSILAGDWEEIDVDNVKVRRSVSNVITNDSIAVTSGDIESFAISPEDGDPITGDGPTIECTGLSLGGSAEISYYRGWL